MGRCRGLNPHSRNKKSGGRASSSSDSHSDRFPWKSWREVPADPPCWARSHKWFLEVFAGEGGFSRSIWKKGGWILPPIDIVKSGFTSSSTDIFDANVFNKVARWCASGCVCLTHFGTPCTSYSRARRFGDGGPPPLRTLRYLRGRPGLSFTDRQKVRMGTRCMHVTVVTSHACI